MKLSVTDIPILLNAAVAVDLGVAADGPVFTVTDAAKGKSFSFRFSTEEAKSVGLGLISGAAVFDFQKAMMQKPIAELGSLSAIRDFREPPKRGRH